MMTVTIKKVQASATWHLRHRVLRPNQSADSVLYPEDALADARHYASYTAIANAADVAIGTVKGWVGEGAKKAVTKAKGKKPGRPKTTGASGTDRWIKIRLNGRELELLESDYLRLYGGES